MAPSSSPSGRRSPKEQQIYNYFDGHTLSQALRSDPSFIEATKQMQSPAAKFLKGPDRLPVSPFIWIDGQGKRAVCI
ncbi:HotDog domain-containing protein [Penicillium herquei]|nr:HotDog domain-containing protein [Penicillium herquei]